MQEDKFINRFVFIVIMFIVSMLLMIIRLFSILFGWDLLGLVSYCLVIYYQNYNHTIRVIIVTVLSNRIGDVINYYWSRGGFQRNAQCTSTPRRDFSLG